MTQLLAHLPLLRPGNTEAKTEYLKIIPMILSHSIKNGCHIEESRQLLSYSLIHPAISGEERSQFTTWLTQLEEHLSYNHSSLYNQHGRLSAGDHNVFTYPDKAALTRSSSWQQPGQRDSGISISSDSGNSSAAVTPASTVVSGLGLAGRPITSSASMCNGNSNGHIPLHATVSGPPAFSSMPSTQGM